MNYRIDELFHFQGTQVRMLSDDGHEVIATLLNVSLDFDGSLHLVYDRVMWANDPIEFATACDSTCYAEGESLVSMGEAAVSFA